MATSRGQDPHSWWRAVKAAAHSFSKPPGLCTVGSEAWLPESESTMFCQGLLRAAVRLACSLRHGRQGQGPPLW